MKIAAITIRRALKAMKSTSHEQNAVYISPELLAEARKAADEERRLRSFPSVRGDLLMKMAGCLRHVKDAGRLSDTNV